MDHNQCTLSWTDAGWIMKPDRLGNILEEMETRITRTQKASSNAGAPELDALKAAVRRCRAKLDKVNIADISGLEKLVANLPYEGDPLRFNNLIAGLKIGLNQMGPDDILDATPGQKLAAFQFGYEGEVLKVVDQPIKPYEREKDIAMAALEAAIQNGIYVNEDLQATNVSPRVRDAFARLQTTMSSYTNIVQIGAGAQICSRYVQMEAEELSSSIAGMLIGHLESVFAALSQFQDWREYCENAYDLHLEPGSIKQLTESAARLVKHLRDIPTVDPAVSDALETVVSWVEDEEHPDKRDVLSLGRTLENIWSAVVKQTFSFAKDTLAATRKLVINAVAAGLLVYAATMVPIISKIPGAQWIEIAYTYIKSVREKP
ncbi:hypothetical protein G6K93_34300 [Agrobacterium rhizogenes]|uniref:hypothetical protein n=1 Tax=Rhizobium rhizogenes TaxID=359 RepID=UPI00115CCEE8|nr:hypothetical protein [Rhizobium rhizogenes]NTF55033.1 hypothetical protein [Rhizobium rhizogenes]NTF74613.1 hypothetical protein [Rhizobium rhizogenes]NTF98400.1 hypothetical protein [Rhizobium rhizogenes]NTH55830.1 hypothetical protein [Rhizobium rhizogenes]NTH75450.1 hypothetical protein [Rhizobium rhizogenes]